MPIKPLCKNQQADLPRDRGLGFRVCRCMQWHVEMGGKALKIQEDALNLGTHHDTRPVWRCARCIDKPLNPKARNPKPQTPSQTPNET